jgi:hypothetical protein
LQLDDGSIFTTSYQSKLPAQGDAGYRANGAPMTGPASLDDPTGITGTFWRPPAAMS